MKNLKKFIATILATTLAFGCIGSMSTFGSAECGIDVYPDEETGDDYGSWDQDYILNSLFAQKRFLKFNELSEAEDKVDYLFSFVTAPEKRLLTEPYLTGNVLSTQLKTLMTLWHNVLLKAGVKATSFRDLDQYAFTVAADYKSSVSVAFCVLYLIEDYVNSKGDDIFDDEDIQMNFKEKVNFKNWIHTQIMSLYGKSSQIVYNPLSASAHAEFFFEMEDE